MTNDELHNLIDSLPDGAKPAGWWRQSGARWGTVTTGSDYPLDPKHDRAIIEDLAVASMVRWLVVAVGGVNVHETNTGLFAASEARMHRAETPVEALALACRAVANRYSKPEGVH